MSGWANQAGVSYQQAHAVLTCLDLLDSGPFSVAAVHVESSQDVFDLELLDRNRSVIGARQIKNRQLSETWTPADLWPILQNWAASTHEPSAQFEILLGGRLGPSGAALRNAIQTASDTGDLSELAGVTGTKLDQTQLEACRHVKIIADPTPTSGLITAAEQQAMSMLVNPRTGADARDEAESLVNRLYMLITMRAGLPESADRIVERTEIASLFGLDGSEVARWDSEARARYVRAVAGLSEERTVKESIRRHPTPIETAVGRTETPEATLEEISVHESCAWIAGQSGSGKTTAAKTIRRLKASTDDVAVIVNAEAFIPERLGALVANGVSEVTGVATPVSVGKAILADDTATVLIDGVSEIPPLARDALKESLTTHTAVPGGCRFLFLGRDAAVLNSMVPQSVTREAYYLHGICSEAREDLVRDVLAELDNPGDTDVSAVTLRATYALKDAANVPYLLAMAAELISYGFEITSRAQMYSVFTEEMARRHGVVDLQISLLGLGIAYCRLLAQGRRQCDQFDWKQLLVIATSILRDHNIDLEPRNLEKAALRGGFVAFEHYNQVVHPVHDSLADFLAALAHAKNLVPLPESATANDALRLRFLAELEGAHGSLANLVTRDVPFASVDIAISGFDSRSHTSPGEAFELFRNLAPSLAATHKSINLVRTQDERRLVIIGGYETSRVVDPNEAYQLGLTHGICEVQGGSLTIAVAVWKVLLERALARRDAAGRIPQTTAEVIDLLTEHQDS